MDQDHRARAPAGPGQPDAAQPRRLARLQRGDADRARRRLRRAGQRRPARSSRCWSSGSRTGTAGRSCAADPRGCDGCSVDAWDGRLPPAIPNTRPVVVDPRHAYQMVSMLEGVVQRGTAKDAQELGKPLAGKTGTTNDNKDTWFVGFSPDLVVAVFVGFDQPQVAGPPRHRRHRGAADLDRRDAATPWRTSRRRRSARRPGSASCASTRPSGRLAGGGDNVIAEAFLPGTEPGRDRSTVEESTEKDPFAVPRGLRPRRRRRPPAASTDPHAAAPSRRSRHARRNRQPRRLDQRRARAAAEASLTGTRRCRGWTS